MSDTMSGWLDIMPPSYQQRRATFWLAALLLICAWPASAALGQGTPLPSAAPDEVTVEVVQARVHQLEDLKELDEAAKGKLRELYQQALQELDLSAARGAEAAQFASQSGMAAERLRKIKTEMASTSAEPIKTSFDTLLRLEQELSKKESELIRLKQELAQFEAEPKRRAARKIELAKVLDAGRDRLATLDKELAASPATDETPPLAMARRTLAQARRKNVQQEIAKAECELGAYEATTELLPVERDLVAGNVVRLEQEVKQLREAANLRRKQETEQQLRRAQEEADRAAPDVSNLAKRNEELAAMRKPVGELIAKTCRQLDAVNQELGKVTLQFKRTQDRESAGHYSEAVGLLMRKHRSELPDVRQYRRDISVHDIQIAAAQMELFQLDDRRSELASLEAPLATLLAGVSGRLDDAGRRRLETTLRGLLQTERDYLDSLIHDYNTYLDRLVDLKAAEQQLIVETRRCAEYIDQRVLWIRSAETLRSSTFRRAGEAALWFAGPEHWREIGEVLLRDGLRHPLPALTASCAFGALLAARGRLRAKIRRIGESAARSNCQNLLATHRTVLMSVIMASFWPGMLGYLAWRLSGAVDASEFAKSITTALATTAALYLPLELLRQLGARQGLAEAHFGWPPLSLKLLRKHLRWLIAVSLPAVFIAAAMQAQDAEAYRDSLGRICFMLGMISVAVFQQRILRPAGGTLHEAILQNPSSWLARTRWIWYPLAVLGPLALATLAMLGYYYAAQELALRLQETVWLILGLVVLRALLLRWLLVNRRKLAIEQARQRRSASTLSEGVAASTKPIAPELADLDLATISTQTRKFVEYFLVAAGAACLWLIWSDEFPALSILNRVQLWQTTINEVAVPITLANAAAAILVLSTSLIASRNIPGLLEMAILQRLPLDAGARYAVSILSRYALTLLGVVLSCAALGLDWSKLKWLVAAISVGLGFGLQEIFAHFVAGLILLFERPIRVGDVVTIGDVTGVVSKIRIRATTVTNWERHELIVPNKDLIIGRVLNWTLSDQVNRLTIPIGVAYGSDTNQARDLLVKIAQEHPVVLREPPPTATFEEFGDSALRLVLRCYLPDLKNRQSATHELHTTIHRRFQELGIEIAYPRRDIVLRSGEPPLTVFSPLGESSASQLAPLKQAG